MEGAMVQCLRIPQLHSKVLTEILYISMHARCTMSIVFLRPKIVFGNETGIVESESSGSLGGEEFASSKPLAYVQQVSIRRFFSFLEYNYWVDG